MFDKNVADLLWMIYNTNAEQMFCIAISKDVCSGLYERRYYGKDHYISRYGSDGYGKGVGICNTA